MFGKLDTSSGRSLRKRAPRPAPAAKKAAPKKAPLKKKGTMQKTAKVNRYKNTLANFDDLKLCMSSVCKRKFLWFGFVS